MWLAAAVDPTAVSQYGAAGILAATLAVVGRFVYRRETERADRLEAELRDVNRQIIDKYVPALNASAAALLDSQMLIADLKSELRIRRERDR